MSKPRVYTETERAAWMKTLPSKKIGGLIALVNSNGEVLLENPTYRDMWIMPGGVVEDSESPLLGAIREVKEELGLELKDTEMKFEGTFYVPSYKKFVDFLNVVFSVNVSDELIGQIKLQQDEIEEYKFVSLENLHLYMPPFLANAFNNILKGDQAVFYDGSVDTII